MTTSDPLFHGWYRPTPIKGRKRKPWVRVTVQAVTRDVAIELAHRAADRHGGGDVYAGPVGVDPNDKEPNP